ncbi:MAG: hypothetical protein RMZ69_30825 [Nostoc sp. ChiQUE01a]|nr:hypothetical protein [Nostoc sp. ChiQUE01a]
MGNSGVNLFDVFVGLFGDRDREKISYSNPKSFMRKHHIDEV